MKRQDLIEKLSTVQGNIESVNRRISTIQSSTYYSIFSVESQRKIDIEFQNKCLSYWKRRFNRISLQLMYNL